MEILLLKNGEIALKGLNRGTFEDVLIKNIRRRLKPLGKFSITKAQSTIYVQPGDATTDLDLAMEKITTVFGLAGIARAAVVEKDFAKITAKTITYLATPLLAAKTFKVEAKRADKAFPLDSPAICRELGGDLLEAYPHLTVDVHNPDITVHIEVRDFGAYIHCGQQPGAGGMPVGSSGKAALLLSGGIDSPVAAHMMAKRGLEITAIHFASPPYTSDRALYKVQQLAQKLTGYCGRITLFVVPFTEIQEQLKQHCPEDYFTLVMRRAMMRIAEKIALREGCGALITGESVGQVASQTMQSIACTDIVTTLPVFRPAIGLDKNEIVAIAQKIDTFETSIQPYDDCCTVFTPRHPRTKPRLEDFAAIEGFLTDEILDRAAQNTPLTMFYPD